MESSCSILDYVLSNDALDNLIQTCSCPQAFNPLIKLKHRRLLEGSCEKIHFSVDCIFNSSINVDLSNDILKTALLINADTNTLITQTVTYCVDKLWLGRNSDEVYYAINLFNVILEHYKREHKPLLFTGDDFDQFQGGVLKVLQGSVKPLITFIIVNVFPNYTCVCDQESKNCFLSKTFDFIKTEKKLEVLCMCLDQFIQPEFDRDDFNLLKCDDFWFLITDCIVDKRHYLQRQAMYLLGKSMDIILNSDNLSCLPQHLQTGANDMKKMWKNYFILLDVSNEKQLHIVEPSLSMFSSVKNLDFLWRSCLYTIFLNHSQNVVVYNVATFILQNETDWHNFSKIIVVLFSAINKNEYNADSKNVFQEMGVFCNKLDNSHFNILLSESLNVSWVPAAIWGLYSNVFNKATNFEIPLLLLENVIKKLKLIPHKFIRGGCIRVVLNYCTRNWKVDSLNDLLKMSLLLRNSDDNLFENFIKMNEEQIHLLSDELHKQIFDFVENSDSEDLERFTVGLKILQLIHVDLDFKIMLQSNTTNSEQLLMLEDYFESTDLENHLISKFDFVENIEHVATLLHLTEKFSSQKLLEKASNILIEESSHNDAQKILAFGVLSINNIQTDQFVQFYKKYVQTFDVKNERIVNFFVKNLIKSLSESCSIVDLEESVGILENALDSQNSVTITILENLDLILKHVQQNTVLRFMERCFDEFVILIKSDNCRTTTTKFLSQIFEPHLLENNDFCEILLQFSWKLLDISNSANSIAYILSEKLTHLVKQKPETGRVFVSVIVELILHGIVVNKSERVDYYVCQEIGVTLPTENNPNLEEISTRLWALESVLFLINEESPSSRNNTVGNFVSDLVERYMKHFSKRYFPDSQIHLEKLRILQTLMLLQKHVTEEKSTLIELLVDSFISETHQPSVKHLMQWLLILLINNDHTYIQNIEEKLKTIDNNRPSAVSGLIPVLYHLIVSQKETHWDRLIEVLLPYTMGAQFRLRVFSQVALLKLHDKAITAQKSEFLQKYQFLHTSLKQIIEATANANFDVTNIHHEFLDYFSLENSDCSTVFYKIPKSNGVTEIEWENLWAASNRHNFKYVQFDHCDNVKTETTTLKNRAVNRCNENIQKKVTPWKDLLDNPEPSTQTNDFILVTSLIEKPANLGGLARTCEVFGIKKMIMRTSKITLEKEFKSLSMSSENWVDISDVKVEDLQEFIVGVKKEGYCVVGAEQTAESVKLEQFEFPKLTVLVLGNEKAGIPANLIPLLDKCVEIPQFGMVRSLNVHVAGAIVMWEYCKQQKL